MHIQKKLPERSAFGDWKFEMGRQLRARSDRFLGYRRLHRMYRERMGVPLNLQSPRTYNEKINWRKIHDRDARFPVISDKLRVRDWVADLLGRAQAEALFPQLHHASAQPAGVDIDALPRNLAIKANHGSGWNIFLREGATVDRALLARETSRWLGLSYGVLKHEWAYQKVPRRVIYEDLLLSGDGAMPQDIKFNMFRDQVGFVIMDTDVTVHPTQDLLTEDWQRVPFKCRYEPGDRLPPKPGCYDDMLALARRIGAGFDMIRVDFLYFDDRYYLNELSLYRGSGMNPFHPPEWDRHFGDMWVLPKL